MRGEAEAVQLAWSDIRWGDGVVAAIINDPQVAFWCAEAGILVGVQE